MAVAVGDHDPEPDGAEAVAVGDGVTAVAEPLKEGELEADQLTPLLPEAEPEAEGVGAEEPDGVLDSDAADAVGVPVEAALREALPVGLRDAKLVVVTVALPDGPVEVALGLALTVVEGEAVPLSDVAAVGLAVAESVLELLASAERETVRVPVDDVEPLLLGAAVPLGEGELEPEVDGELEGAPVVVAEADAELEPALEAVGVPDAPALAEADSEAAAVDEGVRLPEALGDDVREPDPVLEKVAELVDEAELL